jgi:hypothetical protein
MKKVELNDWSWPWGWAWSESLAFKKVKLKDWSWPWGWAWNTDWYLHLSLKNIIEYEECKVKRLGVRYL